jgi:hypothetical protein
MELTERLTSETFLATPESKKLQSLFNANFLDQKGYREKWGKLTSHLKKVFKKTVEGFPDLAGAGFFGEIIITEDKQPDFIRQKSLQFYISVIGPFFSIHAVDKSTALLPVDLIGRDRFERKFTATHAITLSPAFEYHEAFNLLEDELRHYFPGYLFVPYNIGMSTLKNISIADDQRDPRTMDTVYEALFGRRAVHDCLTRGDKRYGMGDWVSPFSNEEKSLMDQISAHIIAAPSEKTIHKVWKLRETKRLDTFIVTGNLMFGIDTFEVMDLTDKSTMIVIWEKDRKTPGSFSYEIIDDVITFSETISYKIISLTADSLTLHVIIDLVGEDFSAKGAAAELIFIQMKKIE